MDDDDENIKSIDEENIDFRNYLSKKKINCTCQVCGSKNFRYWISENPLTLPIMKTDKNKTDLQTETQFYWLECDNCFNIIFFRKTSIDHYLNAVNIHNRDKKDDTENE